MRLSRKLWIITSCYLLLVFVIPSCGHAGDGQPSLSSITIVCDDNYPPYIFRDVKGAIQGIIVDQWRLWEKKTGIKAKLLAMDWRMAQDCMLREEADVIDTMFYNDERARFYDFTKPYAKLEVPVFFHKDLGGIVDIGSLHGFTIGVKAGDACIDVLKKHGITSLREYNSYEAIVKASANHQLKVFSIDKPPALYYLYKMGLEDEFRHSLNLYTGEFHRAVKKGRTDLLLMVENGFSLISADEYDAIEKKWRGESFTSPAYFHYFLPIFLFASAVFLALLFFNLTLRRKVREKTAKLQQTLNQFKQSEEKYRELVNNANSIIIRRDATGTVTFINEFAQKFFGYREEEILGENIVGTIIPEIDSAGRDLKRMIEDITNHPERYINNANENMRRGGERVWIAWTNKPAYDDRGMVTEFLCIGNDITERKRAEEALAVNEQFLRLITDNIQDAIRVVDLQTLKYTYANPYVKKLFGIPSEQYVGMNLGVNLVSGEGERLFQMMQEELQHDGERDPSRFRIFELQESNSTTGENLWTENKASFIRDGDGKPIAVLSITRDITEHKNAERERQRLEERLRRAEKMEAMGTLAGGVAHDLNNVLGVLVGYSELLLEKIPKESPIRRYVDNILQSGLRGAAIIQDLLTLARRGVPVSEVANLNLILHDYFNTLEFEKLKSDHPHVVFKMDLEENLLNIKGSPVHLGKAFMNLVTNAIESMPDLGEVSIRTENCYLDRPVKGYDDIKEGNYVVLTVSDTGKGISAQDLGKIFEPFYTKKVMGRSGTGLGLTVVWGTVRDHDGYIDVQSEEERGSTFTIYLPVTADVLIGDRQRLSTEAYLGRGESILVVDDVKEQRELAMAMLKRLDYKVDAVSSGEEALVYLEKNKVDLIVLDMIMDPGMDGLETFRRIRGLYPQQKAIIVSGFSETERVKKAQELGAGEYVRKPYVMEKIGLAVRSALDV